MMLSLSVLDSNPARVEVATVELRSTISGLDGVEIRSEIVEQSDTVARVTGLEVLAALITSAAGYQLASALRDFVNRQRVTVEITREDGVKVTVDAVGGDTKAVADLVGFLTGGHKKVSAGVPEKPEQ